MHLSECTDLFSETNKFDAEVWECTVSWLFKTKTEFYGWDLSLDYLFGFLCWSYTIAGIMMLVLKSKWMERSSFPTTTFALILIFLQGPLSFSADYLNMTNESMVHVVDRFMACLNVAFFAWRLSAFYFNARPAIFFSSLAASTFALFSFMNSQDAQESRDRDAFVFWHNLWHLYPFQCILIESYDVSVLGEYECEVPQTGPKSKGKIFSNLKSALLYGVSTNKRKSLSVQTQEKKVE